MKNVLEAAIGTRRISPSYFLTVIQELEKKKKNQPSLERAVGE